MTGTRKSIIWQPRKGQGHQANSLHRLQKILYPVNEEFYTEMATFAAVDEMSGSNPTSSVAKSADSAFSYRHWSSHQMACVASEALLPTRKVCYTSSYPHEAKW